MQKRIYLVGFGSQGRAWAECLRDSGWDTQVFLARESESFRAARGLGFEPELITGLPKRIREQGSSAEPALIAFLCPDSATGGIYRDFLAPLELPLTLILAHGFAVYSGDLLAARPEHHLALLAPKAIGPKLRARFAEARRARPEATHSLAAAVFASGRDSERLEAVASGLGFARERLIAADFRQETVGDLLSEQGLLCGSTFTFLKWTIEAMTEAGVPDALIREECLTELELIAGILRERGPAATLKLISPAAQCGTVRMMQRLESSGAKADFDEQMAEVTRGEFAETYRSSAWRQELERLVTRFESWEKQLEEKRP